MNIQLRTRKDFARIINERGYKTGAEVGIGHGGFSRYLLSNSNLKALWCIDPQSDKLPEYKGAGLELSTERLKPFVDAGRCVIVRSTSRDAIKKDSIWWLDFIYIDGDHHYHEVLFDIVHWWGKLKPGGLLAGHDYSPSTQGDVVRAVTDFTTAHFYNGVSLHLTGVDGSEDAGMECGAASWAIFKPLG